LAPVRRCFTCSSTDHLADTCPKRPAARQYKFGSTTPRAAANACMVGEVSAGNQIHHDMEGELSCKSSNDIEVTKDMYNSAVHCRLRTVAGA